MASVAAILPETKNSSMALTADELIRDLQLGTYYISPDQLSEIIINKDPGYTLIDLRSPEEYEQFSLPGAINIPFDSIFDEDWVYYFDRIDSKNILYSNGGELPSKAFALLRQKGFKNNYVLQSGLNGWFDTILNPEQPESTEDDAAMALYRKRMATKQYFTGGSVKIDVEVNTDLKPVPVRKKKRVQGGCS